jgi:hypothetical protein
MKLDRNINGTGRGKYGLINHRRLLSVKRVRHISAADEAKAKAIEAAIELLETNAILDWGDPGTEGEFFVIKLRDEHAQGALRQYSIDARYTDQDYAHDVADLARRAGADSPFCKKPD